METRVTPSGVHAQGPSGQTLWGGDCQHTQAGLAWDWTLIGKGVVAMADPMCVISNLRLLGPRGQVLTGYEAALHFSRMVHRLRWQDEVWRVLRSA